MPESDQTENSPNEGSSPSTRGRGDIADYELLEVIGSGGMGTVHKARQISLNRLVALKTIKPGMDSQSILARFETERQALALMDHPNIARVFDAGRTDDRRPFFVMELVEGRPITRFCDEHGLSIRDRLELFVTVCQAIQHAHQKGVIHRDIKPSNVLVALQDGRPSVKIIDFGIAKAIGPQLGEQTAVTQWGSIIGTPEYMAPEQTGWNAIDIDTRADIYALGVLLYQMLTGTTPLDRSRLDQLALDEVVHRIREEDPPPPSVRVVSLSEPTTRLARQLRGEVDWIVMKALEKDRERRYETAASFARDVQRHLQDEPVLAGPPTTRYRLGKFVRKHRRSVLAAAVFAVLLMASAVVSTVMAVRANIARQQADAARSLAHTNEQRALQSEADTDSFARFLVQDVLRVARPKDLEGGLGIDVTVAAALEAAEPDLERQFHGRPKAEAMVRHSLGITWDHLGRLDRAEQQLRRAAELRATTYGPDAEETIVSQDALGLVWSKQGRIAEAMASHERLLTVAQTRLGSNHVTTAGIMNNLALDYGEGGRLPDAIRLLQGALLTPGEPAAALTFLDNLANLHRKAGHLTNALDMSLRSVELHRARLGTNHPSTVVALNNLALIQLDMGRDADALPLLEEAVRLTVVQRGSNHPVTIQMLNNAGVAQARAGHYAESRRLHARALAAAEATLGPQHVETLMARNNLAVAFGLDGHEREAFDGIEQSLQVARASLGENHPNTLQLLRSLGSMHLHFERASNAIPLLEQAVNGLRTQSGERHPTTAAAARELGLAYDEVGRTDDALPMLELAYTIRKARLTPADEDLLRSTEDLAALHIEANRWSQALPYLEERVAGHRAGARSDPKRLPRLLSNLGAAYMKTGQLSTALPLLEEALALFRKDGVDHPEHIMQCLNNAALALEDDGRHREALPLFEEMVQRRLDTLPADDPKTLAAQNVLGRSYYKLNKLDDAIRVWQDTMERRKRTLGADHRDTLLTTHSLAQALRLSGKTTNAIALLEEAIPRDRSTLKANDPQRTFALEVLASCYEAVRRWPDATTTWRELLELQRTTLRTNSTTLASTLHSVGDNLLRENRATEAAGFLEQSLAIRRLRAPDHWSTFLTLSRLGTARLVTGHPAEAESMLIEGATGLEQRRAQIPSNLRPVVLRELTEAIDRLYQTLGTPDASSTWKQRLLNKV
jgi:serine/threonine protein kinase/tetratricopeptide (TPR) repeat protein